MEERVKKDIISILDDALDYIRTGKILNLKELSDHTVHNASIFQDQESISIAVIMYALSKLFDRDHGIDPVIVQKLKDSRKLLINDKFEEYKQMTKKIFELISKKDNKLGMYIEEVIEQAEIKKSSRIYEHGISMAQASSLLGVSQWELMNYIGKTKIMDMFKEPIDINERIKFTRTLFN
jgi:hypothetical protein